MRALALSGSLRAASTNTMILRALAAAAPAGVVVEVYAGLAELPHFNPDLEALRAPEAVAHLRAAVAGADAVIVSTPEYAHGLPGALKNGLDWLVGSGELYGKPVGLVHVSARARHARVQLREVLLTLGAQVVDAAELDLDLSASDLATGGLDARLRAGFAASLEALAYAVGDARAERAG